MDELKEVVGLISSLPTLATWVFVGFFAYKVVIVGSLYGTVRFVVEKIYLIFKQEVSKSELANIIDEHERKINYMKNEVDIYRKESAKDKAETERVLHMYQILKEAKNDK